MTQKTAPLINKSGKQPKNTGVVSLLKVGTPLYSLVPKNQRSEFTQSYNGEVPYKYNQYYSTTSYCTSPSIFVAVVVRRVYGCWWETNQPGNPAKHLVAPVPHPAVVLCLVNLWYPLACWGGKSLLQQLLLDICFICQERKKIA